MIELPPVAPAVKGIETVVVLVTVTVPIVGACGTEEGVTVELAEEFGPVAVELVALTV